MAVGAPTPVPSQYKEPQPMDHQTDLKPDDGAPAASRRDRVIDAIVTTRRLTPSRRTRELRERPIPEEHLRTLLALFVLAERDLDRDLLADQHLVSSTDLLKLLPPRKQQHTRTLNDARVAGDVQAPALKTTRLLASLDWLADEGLIDLEHMGPRRYAHRVQLTLDWENAPTPTWPHARKLAVDSLTVKRLTPARIAILSRLAYVVGANGSGDALPAADVEDAVGLTMKWVLRQLRSGELGAEHGLASWSARRGAGGLELAIQLCEPDETCAPAKPLVRLHRAFIADVLANGRDGGEEADDAQPPKTAEAQVQASSTDEEGTGEAAAATDADDTPAEQHSLARKHRPTDAELRPQAIELWRQLWHKEMVEQAVKLAEAQLKAGRKITMSRRINNFYRPVVELQEKYGNPPLLRYALEQTIAGPSLRQPDTQSWVKYLAKVCANNSARYSGDGPRPGTNAAKQAEQSIEAREQEVRGLLEQAYQLNKAGETGPARTVLSDILSRAAALAELFDGDIERTRDSLRLAFKQGSTDFVGARPNPYAPVDYLPEWEPAAAVAR